MTHRFIFRFFLFPFLFLSALVAAQGIEGLKNYSVKEGLSQGNVTCLVNDKLGFLWLGTDNGLNRFDGNSFRKYQNNPHDTTSLSSNYVSALAVDNSGKVWIGTENGIDIYNPVTDKIAKFKSWKPPHKSKKIRINKLNFLSNNLLLVSTDVGFATVEISSGKYSGYFGMVGGVNDSVSKNFTALFINEEKTIWLGTENGELWKFTNGTISLEGKITCEHPDESHTINSISEYKEGQNEILIVAANCGIRFFNLKNKISINLWKGNSPADTLCNSAYVDVLKMGTDQFILLEDRRISMIDFKTQKTWDLINNEADDDKNFTNYHQLLLDQQGILWIGDYGKGVWSYSTTSTKMMLVTSDPVDLNHVKNPNVLSFCEAGDSVFIGSGWGIDVLNLKNKRVTDYSLFPGKEASDVPVNVLSILPAENHNVWFFGKSSINGLVKLNPKTGEQKIYSTENGLSNLKCVGMLKMKDGTFWLATKDKGIEMYDPTSGSCYFMLSDSANPNSLSSNRINNLFLDSKGKVWASSDKGLNCVDPVSGKVKRYRLVLNDSTSISSEDVNGVAEDLKGTIWVATNYGFGKLNETTGKFKNYSSDNGLPDNFVNGILADSLGFLWISTNNGLCSFDPAKETFKVYGTEDGLQGLEFNAGSMLYGKSGMMYFGGVNGFNYFNPKNARKNTFEPPVYITGISIYGHPYLPDSNIILKKRIELDYKQNFLLFHFVALNYYMPEKNRFSVMMEGVDEDWVNLGDKKTISYPGLAPGEYILHVKAYNNDGVGNETGTTLTIIIRPPFWRTKWFYTLCIIVGALLIWGYMRRRERKLRKEKQILEAKVEERTTELRFEKEKVSAAHKDIQDSINYARRIQNTILHGEVEWKNLLPDSFVLYHPRDVVSGDFFWLYQQGEKLLIACADCTGHGVPGAFMSMIGHTHLNEIAGQEKISDPGIILEQLHLKVTRSLKQDAGSETRDGMDIALISIDYKKNEIQYAGANRPLFLVRDGNAEDYKSDKYCIGGGYDVGTRKFVTNTIEIKKGDMLYMFSDGYADQFGGTKGKKFGKKQLRELLLKVSELSMEHQKDAIDAAYEEWKGDLEQVDDILLIGIRI
jgi:ligand-binding sensor domain-containing protein/serine phosphatase RsbU (regulator of sigma subunit)